MSSQAAPLTEKNKFTEEFTKEKIDTMLASRNRLKEYVFKNAQQGDVQSVIDTIDHFGWTEQWLMNVGDRKGAILDQAIRTRKPKTVLELGTFLGYSSLRMIAQLSPQSRIISIEADEESAKIARSIHDFAGVSDRITVIDGYTHNIIPQLREMFQIDAFDLIFIDHFKDAYLPDLKMLEEKNFIQSGTMVVADNVITPGAPDYLEHVRNNPHYKTTFHEGTIEYRDDLPDGIEISIRE